MALRFRTLLPFAIPGVLALLGWWWFSSRKKERVSNHDRRGRGVVEECRIGSPEREARSREDLPSDSELALPPDAKLPVESAVAFEPSVERQAPLPEHRGKRLASSPSEPPVGAKLADEPGAHQDDGEKLEAMGCQGTFRSPGLESSFPDGQNTARARPGEAVMEGKPDCAQALELAPSTAASWQLPCRERSGESRKDLAVQNSSSESRIEGPPATTTPGSGCMPAHSSEEVHEAVAEEPVVDEKKVNRGMVDVSEPDVRMAANQRTGSWRVDTAQGAETSSSNTGSILKHQGGGEVGCKGGVERKKLGGISLDKEEVEKIEQVAIHIISNVIRAATEEVLSGSVNSGSGIMCPMASGTEKPLEMASVGATGQALSGEEDQPEVEKAAHVETPPLSEETDACHAVFSSHLTHGLLANPGAHGRTRDTAGQDRPASHPAAVLNHEGDLEDIQAVAEDSGCSACASEDGTSVEDLLKSTSSPPLQQQRLGLLEMPGVKGSEGDAASSQKPHSPTLAEDKVPYSNGMLKEDGPPLGHEPSWPGEADTDHSGGSDVNSMDSVDSGCAVRKNGSCLKSGADSNKTELVIWEIEVPKHLVGRLIGKQGRYVSFLKQVSGAKIYISTLPYTQDFQICHIEGSQQNVDKALTLIGKKFKDLSLTNIYAPPPPSLPLHSLPMTSWLMLPDGVTVEVIVVNQVNAGHLFVQQHTHPTFHVLRSLDQQMYLCYSQPGIPTMPTPVEVGVVCAAPGVEGAWWRAQVVGYFKDTSEVEIRYVDYGGYERVKIDTLRQIRSDFVTLPFQGAEVLLDNVVPLPDDDQFSSEADAVVSEMTRGTPLLAQVTNYDSATGLPLIQLWSMIGDELVSINRTLVERGFAQWVESY